MKIEDGIEKYYFVKTKDEIGLDFDVEGKLEFRCYNILNFFDNQQIHINVTNSTNNAERTIISNEKKFTHVRVAEQWNPETADSFAVSYLNSDKGLM